MKKWIIKLATVAVAVGTQAAVIVDDNFSTYSGYLNGNGNWVAGTDWTNVTGGVTSPDFKRAYYNQAINLGVGDKVTVTLDNSFTTTTKNGNLLRFGLRGDAGLGNVANAYNFARIEIRNTGDYRFYGDGNLGTAPDASVITAANLGTADNLQVVWSLTKSASADVFDVTAQSFNVTSNTAYTLWSGAVTNAAMYADTSLFFGMDSQNGLTKGKTFLVENVNVNVIPEPATLGLVAAMGGAVLFIRRRFMM